MTQKSPKAHTKIMHQGEKTFGRNSKQVLKIEKRFGLLEAFFADGHVVELLVSRVHYDVKRIVPFLQVGESGDVARKSAGFIAILFPTFRHVGAIAKLQA